MNPDFPQNERAKLEAQLTALLLGELHASEVAELSKAMEKDPELAALYERLKVTIDLVREGAAQPKVEEQVPRKLSSEKREKLLASFKTVKPQEFVRPRRVSDWLVPMAAVLAIVGVSAAMLLPSFSRATYKASSGVKTEYARTHGISPEEASRMISKEMETASQAAAPASQPHAGFALVGPLPQATPAQNVLPPGQEGDAGAVPGRSAEFGPIFAFGSTFVTNGVSGNQTKSVTLQSLSSQASSGYVDTSVSWNLGTGNEGGKSGQFTLPGGQPADANGNFYTGGKRDDLKGLRYLETNAVVASAVVGDQIPIYYATSSDVSVALKQLESQTTNSDGENGLQPSVAIADSRVPTNNGLLALNDATHSAGIIQGEKNGKTEIFLPSSQQSVLMSKERRGAKDEMRLNDGVPIAGPNDGDGETNSNNRVGSVASLPNIRLPVGGGKQVELAAAARDNGRLGTETVKIDTEKFNKGLEAASGGRFAGEYDKPSEFVPTTQAGNGGVPLTGQLPIPGSGVRQEVDQRNVLSMDRMAQVEKGWSDESTRAKLPAPLKPRAVFGPSNVIEANVVGYVNVTNQRGDYTLSSAAPSPARSKSDSNWWAAAKSVRGFYDDNANSTVVRAAEIAPYTAAEEQLEEAKKWRQVLAMKAQQESVDANLPRTQTVAIIDPAVAPKPENFTLGEKIKKAFTGKVESTTRIQIEQERPDIAGAIVFGNVGGAYDPYFLLTEFESIQSHEVLRRVAEAMDLKDKWGKKYNKGNPMSESEIEDRLKGRLDLHNIRNTKSIEIKAYGDDPQEAADIANAVAKSYQNYRSEEYNELKNHGINSLKEQMGEQDQKIAMLQSNVNALAKSINVSGTTVGIPVSATQQSDTALPKPAVPPPTPQPEILTRENAFSTFSLNVSDVSFKLAAASLEKGQMPEPASIRSEEFINAFDYRDPDARDGAAVAFASERARYPFAHNRELLRFSLKTAEAGRAAGRPLNIVLLLDNSGSMERADRVRIIQEALRVLAGQLQAADTFSIVTFARTARLQVDGVPGNQAGAAAAEIAKLTPEGGTNLGDALELAYATALRHYLVNGDNRVVLLTDGAANLGDVNPEVLKQKVETHRQQGVALDCFGIGWEGYNDDLLEVLTRNGDGRYGFINTPEEATTEFVAQIAGALHVAASDVKVQVEFNPKRVTSYRQIGYAKHQLTKEQFRDNTVDAAEIAAQEAGNALYTTETDPQGEGSIATVRVRYKVPGTAEYREQAWDVPYTGGAVALDQASPAMRLAATAGAFSEWLATSPFAAEVSPDQLLNYLSGVPQVYGADTRPAKLEWMIRQARSISGK